MFGLWIDNMGKMFVVQFVIVMVAVRGVNFMIVDIYYSLNCVFFIGWFLNCYLLWQVFIVYIMVVQCVVY